jgi:hypothetical protein
MQSLLGLSKISGKTSTRPTYYGVFQRLPWYQLLYALKLMGAFSNTYFNYDTPMV